MNASEKANKRALEVAEYILKNNASILNTAKHFQVSPATISDDIHKRLSSPLKEEVEKIVKANTTQYETSAILNRVEEVQRLHQEGKSIREIARTLQVSPSTVLKDLKRSILHKPLLNTKEKESYAGNQDTNLYNQVITHRIEQVLSLIAEDPRPFYEVCESYHWKPEEIKRVILEVGGHINYEKQQVIIAKNHWELEEIELHSRPLKK